jgi:hypothetical protein
MNEVQELRVSSEIVTEAYNGRALTRIFHGTAVEFPMSEADLDTAMALGSVLPAAWGGPAGTNVQSPRLQSRGWKRQDPGAKIILQTSWVQIDVPAGTTDYGKTTKSDQITYGQFENVKMYYAITTNAAHASIPSVGKTEAGATPTAITDWICRSVQVIQNWQYGRHLVVAQFAQGRAKIGP